MRLRHFCALVLASLPLWSGCTSSSKPSGPLQVPLTYRLTKTQTLVAPSLKATVFISVLDERTRKDAIGQNTEKPEAVLIKSSDDPAAFVKGVLARELQNRGAVVAPDEASAKRQIILRLTTFWTDETDLYRTSVAASVKVLGAGGGAAWEGSVKGGATNFGRSLSAGNYQETITEATTEMVTSLLNSPKVTQALTE